MNTVDQTLIFAKPFYLKSKNGDLAWNDHIPLVRKYAIKLAQIEKADQLVVEIAAILHDIGKAEGREGHAVRGYELAKPFVEGLSLTDWQKDMVLECIQMHGGKQPQDDDPIEVKVIQSADALGVLFDDEWQEYSRQTLSKDELLGLYDKTYNKIRLQSARELVAKQLNKLKVLLNKSI